MRQASVDNHAVVVEPGRLPEGRAALTLLRSESRKTKMIALGLSVLDGLYGCCKLSTLENCVLLGTHGVATAAYVTTLLIDPEKCKMGFIDLIVNLVFCIAFICL